MIVDMSQATKELQLDAKVFERTPNLKYLKFCYSEGKDNFNVVQLLQGLESFLMALVKMVKRCSLILHVSSMVRKLSVLNKYLNFLNSLKTYIILSVNA